MVVCCSSTKPISLSHPQAGEIEEELMAVMEDGDPVTIFAGYADKMEKFLNVNPGLSSRIYWNFVFPDYFTEQLDKIFHRKPEQKGFKVDANLSELLSQHTTPAQRKSMNARLVRILLQEAIDEASNSLPLNAPLSQLIELKESDSVSLHSSSFSSTKWSSRLKHKTIIYHEFLLTSFTLICRP